MVSGLVVKLADNVHVVADAVATVNVCYSVVGRLRGILWHVSARTDVPTVNKVVSTPPTSSNDLHARYVRTSYTAVCVLMSLVVRIGGYRRSVNLVF